MHFRSAAFERDYINNKNIVESSSLYRKFRMEELLAQHGKLSPQDAAAILRDQKGLNNCALGLGNEKGINQLLAHHSVIFKPKAGLVWVSTAPYQLGKYVCYDLNRIFNQATGEKELQDSSRTIASDPFLYSPEYKNFLLFKQIRHYLEFCTKSDYRITAKPNCIQAFERCNPDSYLTYQVLGNYYARLDSNAKAHMYYEKALSKVVATKTEEEQIRSSMRRLNQHTP